ncbi:MAG TPA: outer membrane protein transport protein [Acidobacteriota bacterium]|nr:outer membrane protein transport protein [Acidobacteriota bacterium]
MKKMLFIVVLLLPVVCNASGYALYEMNARAHGMAHAYIVRVDDPSAVWYNPAALTRVEGTEIYGSGTWINTSGDFTSLATGANIEAVDGNFFPPNFYVGHQLSDNWVLGVGVYTPFGLRTEWPQGSLPTFISQKADLKVFYVTPSIAYRITPNISVGGGFDFAWSEIKLERNINIARLAPVVVFNEVDADGTDFGFNVGTLIETNSNVDFAVTYKHKIEVDYEGDVSFTGVPPAFTSFFPSGETSLELPLPSQLMFGASTTFEKLSIEGDLIFSFWDDVDVIRVDFLQNTPALLDPEIVRNFENSWSLRLGAEYNMTDQWALRGGYVYDETPVPDQAVDPILPDGSRNGITFGVGYMGEGWTFDIGYMVLFFEDRTSPLNNFVTTPGNVIAAGDYTNHANLLSFGFGYKF